MQNKRMVNCISIVKGCLINLFVEEHEEFLSPWQNAMSKTLDNIKDELILEIKVRRKGYLSSFKKFQFVMLMVQAQTIISHFLQDIKESLFGLTSKDGTVKELDEEEECQSCDGSDDFDSWKYCLKLGPEWQSEVHLYICQECCIQLDSRLTIAFKL